MPTRTIPSTGPVLSLVLSRATGINIFRLEGFKSGADGYVQFFDAITVPANGTRPLRSVFVQGTFAIFENWQPSPVHFENLTTGLIAVVSTTEDTLTAAVVGQEVDFFCDIEEYEFLSQGYSTAGDLTTGVKNLTVWTEVDGPKKLLSLLINNNVATDYYVMLFAKNVGSLVNGDIPILARPLPKSTTRNLYHFGNNAGTLPYRQDADGTKRQGCTIAISSTPATLTALAGNDTNIQAFYK